MALGTKGVTLRLSNSSELVTVASSLMFTNTTGTSGIDGRIGSRDSTTLDLSAQGLSAGMRLVTNDTGATSVYTIFSIASSVIRFKKSTVDVFVPNLATTSLAITGYNMEEIGEIVSIDGPSGSVNVIDITNLGSTAREKLVAIQDEGQVTMEVLTNLTTDSTAINQWKLRDLRQAGIKSFFDIRFTDQLVGTTSEPSAYFFEGFVTNYGNAVALDDAVKTAITLEISSQAHFINAVSS